MPHHFRDLLDELKGRLARMGAVVQQQVEQAVDSVRSVDARLARQVIDADARVDGEEVGIERDAINLLALYQPTAGDLRFITMVIKVNSDLERIADCAVNVAERVVQLAATATPRYQAPGELRLMADTVVAGLRDTIRAFNLLDEAVARRILAGDDVVDALYAQIIQDNLLKMRTAAQHVDVYLSTIMIAKNLERVADHCTNIAEDVVYVHSGQIIRHRPAG